MSYITRFNLVEDGTFRNRLQVALWIAAANILAEPVDTPQHAARATWANRTLKGVADSDKMRIVAIRATANPSIGEAGADSSDDDIQYVVNGLVAELI